MATTDSLADVKEVYDRLIDSQEDKGLSGGVLLGGARVSKGFRKCKRHYEKDGKKWRCEEYDRLKVFVPANKGLRCAEDKYITNAAGKQVRRCARFAVPHGPTISARRLAKYTKRAAAAKGAGMSGGRGRYVSGVRKVVNPMTGRLILKNGPTARALGL